MRSIIFPTLLLSAFFWFWIPQEESLLVLDPEDKVESLLVKLAEPPAPHQPDLSIPGVSIEHGKALFQTGISMKPGGGKTTKQSRHFVCTSCHNIQREDPDLRISDPQARLEYAQQNGLPFLQGTALYGAVNRRGFYNGDYEKKYGDLVRPARNDLREAIQLCAVECSQGRLLEPWEMESILAYLWTLELKVDDLVLSSEEQSQIALALDRKGDQKAAAELLRSKYLKASPATFLIPPEDRKIGYENLTGNPDNGKLIYELSCLHCHEAGRYSFFELDDAKLTFKYLEKHMTRYTRYSLYQVGRYGTSPLNGRRTYMPNYTEEKMSNQQMEDLRAYIELRAGD